jgi:7-carboxy-7-deazaguanine synthase
VAGRIANYPERHVVITGGEPLLAPDIENLTAAIKKNGYHVTVESAGTIFRSVRCDLISLSPKLSNSTPRRRQGGRYAARHEARRLNPAAIQTFIDRYDYQLKFVVDRPEDLQEVQEVLRTLSGVDPSRVLMMPQGTTKDELRDKARWLRPLAERHGFGFTARRHIELFGNRRGT